MWPEEHQRPSQRHWMPSGELNERVAYMEATIANLTETLASLRSRIAHGEQTHEHTLEYRMRLEHQISTMTQRLHAMSHQLKALETHKETQAETTERWLTIAKWGGAAALGLATLMGKMQAETVTKVLGALLK